MDLLLPHLGLIVWTLLAFLIVFFILKKFAWKPILKMLSEREENIAEALNSAKKAKEEMASLKADNERLLNEARAERDKMLKGLPAGEHAFHIHAVGKCEPPFTTAGGHFNPGNKKHGLHSAEGHHAGDMPNLVIPASGSTTVEVLNAAVTLEKGKPNSLIREGGTSIVVHEGKDDYKSDPAGDAGGRAACGVR